MSETFLLSLEVDDNGSIKVQNFKKNVEGAGSAAEDTGKKAEGGSKGFQIFGHAAAKLGEDMGIPYRASHLLGTNLERMAQNSLPAWGMALGGGAIAAAVVVGVVQHLIESHKKHQEELQKEIDLLSQMTDTLYKNTYATAGLNKAQDKQADSARITEQTKLAEQYQDQYEKLQKLNAAAAAGGTGWDRYWASLYKTNFKSSSGAMEELKVNVQNAARDAGTALDTLYEKLLKVSSPSEKKQYDTLQYQIQYEKEYQSVLKARGGTLEEQHAIEVKMFDLETQNLKYKMQTEGMESGQIKTIIGLREQEEEAIEASFQAKNRDNDWIARRIAVQKDGYARDAEDRSQDLENERAYLELRKSLGISSISEQMAAESEIWNAETFDKEQKMRQAAATEDQINQMRSTREIQHETATTNEKKKLEKLKQQYEIDTLNHAESAFKLMSELGGKHGRQFFTAYKLAAEGKTIISTANAAMTAYEEGGPYLGPALAAAIVAEGAAQLATIRAQTYDGGGGAASIGTYSVDSSSGLPNGGGYKYYGYEQSHYGSGWRPGEGPTGGGNTYNITAMDSKSFEKYCKENPNAITAVVNQNIKDGGETKKTIARYT